MNCLEFRRVTLIDPGDQAPAWLEHRATCTQCQRFSEQMIQQDELIREAALIAVPESFAARILLNQSLQAQSRRPTRWVRLSLAASLLLAVTMFTALLGIPSFNTIGGGVLAHLDAHDVLAAPAHASHSNPMEVQQVLAAFDTQLVEDFDNIVYAANCIIDGEQIAHLVIEKDNSEYVVFLIPESTLINRAFSNDRWRGQLASLNSGTLAVVSDSKNANLKDATNAFLDQFQASLSSGQTI